ncbi:hypothetical protein [Enterococcus faecium]|uniref:HNH endonuclease n=1 Tax=Enterococcus faecium TaxID=1352 RepID=A0A7V7GK37_ENTFC|nr:hypothetical protein [Enterococcus faecium]KAA0686396.1 hypothetical protein DTX73_14030 [Enterococcus faecium]MBK5028688.1 hypothetical protein [Enterococcus faecium]MBK5039390.1 hypothetical protein [Enterococcus faecium]MBK5044314.1 hypothetical protein [Enterococcus faecium]MBK5069349.1 hypothetical protein [Enterococcus faecium]
MENNLDLDMVKILTQPVVPYALHYQNPRGIMGKTKWNKLKKEYQNKANHHCMICKKYVSHKPGDWLELHEKYDYDFDRLIQKLTGYVAICHSCHMYIHQGLLGIQVQTGQVSKETARKIVDKGDLLLEQFNLKKIEYPNRENFEKPNWKLEFEGELYSL